MERFSTGARVLLCWLAMALILPLEANSQNESMKSLPDWSGWWGLERPITSELRQEPPPLKPEVRSALFNPRPDDTEYERTKYCRPGQFTGYSGGFVESVEFLFTPGRVTVTSESGLVRRIYTDGRPFPRELQDSNMGTSIGHWEGQTLVVETAGISPKARYPGAFIGAVPMGKGVKITERISLKSRGVLAWEIVTVAPDIMTQPDERTRLYNRVPKNAATEITFCTDHDRAIDPATGNQRFDMTPPTDLPPPPPAR